MKGSEADPIESRVFSSELIFDKIPRAPDHHCSTLAEAPNGDLLCVWYGGSYEVADDEVLYLARRRKGPRDVGSTAGALARRVPETSG